MYLKNRSVLSILLASLMAGCGGGGDGKAESGATISADAVSRAEGIYEGAGSDGSVFEAVILENDEFWVISGRLVGQVFGVSSLLTGQGRSVSGSFASSDVRQYGINGLATSGTLSSSYIAGKSWNGTISSGNQVASFTGAVPVNTSFAYNKAASLADISGTWSGQTLDNSSGSISISSTGVLTGSISGCRVTGTMKPRASGKNVFDVAFQFGSAPCLAAGQNVSGIAVSYLLDSSKRQLIVSGVTADKALGSVFLAVR